MRASQGCHYVTAHVNCMQFAAETTVYLWKKPRIMCGKSPMSENGTMPEECPSRWVGG